MEYKYHCQSQAESFAKTIIPVPENYPLRDGLPGDFPEHFAALCEVAKSVYLDMAKQPESYGLMLVDAASKDTNLIRNGFYTIHRFVDTLNVLCLAGQVEGHALTASVPAVKEQLKSIPKYALILDRLSDFGFRLTGFDGKKFDSSAENIQVEYPDNPRMIDTLKVYCECWAELSKNRPKGAKERKKSETPIKLQAQEFGHHFYRFDYKITADMDKIPMLQWVNDEAAFQGYDERLKCFNEAFYKESLNYPGLKFNGDYEYKGRRIARITQIGWQALGKPNFKLSVKLSEPDRYMDAIKTMPESIQKHFAKSYCVFCDFQGATTEKCNRRKHWNFDGQARVGCADRCFFFDDFNAACVPDYWRLLMLDNGLKKSE
jgi:hypothetical protein